MILYEDNHLLVVFKTPGQLAQGDKTGDDTVLDQYKAYIKEKYNKPGAVFLHAAHRLDRPVSGCLILIRTSKALSRVTTSFRTGKVQKLYHALATDKTTHPEGGLTHYLRKDTKRNKTKVFENSVPDSKKAKLEFSLAGAWQGTLLYRIHPLTGRSHQIRAQMAHIGSPILGDVKYGGEQIDNPKMIYLHCSAMVLEHPVRKEPLFISTPPFEDANWSDARDFIMDDIMSWEEQILGG